MKYALSDFLRDMDFVQQARDSSGSIEVSQITQFTKRCFESIYGWSPEVEWRFEKFMLVTIYLAKNRHAFDFGYMAIIGTGQAQFREDVISKVLNFATENDVLEIGDFPPPERFTISN